MIMSTASSQKVRRQRRYSQDFRQARVDDFEKGTFSVAQLSRLYHIRISTLYGWISRYSRYPKTSAVIVEVPKSQQEKVKSLESRVAELERLLGRKQIQLDYYEAFVEELQDSGVDVEKKAIFLAPSSESCLDTKDK